MAGARKPKGKASVLLVQSQLALAPRSFAALYNGYELGVMFAKK